MRQGSCRLNGLRRWGHARPAPCMACLAQGLRVLPLMSKNPAAPRHLVLCAGVTLASDAICPLLFRMALTLTLPFHPSASASVMRRQPQAVGERRQAGADLQSMATHRWADRLAN